jgi:peptidoglycan/LPS O-acetylase OafA/YrhL
MDQSPAPAPHAEAHPKQRLIRRTIALFHGALEELAVPKERRNPYLDGLRTIAVLLVINGHCSDAISTAFGSNAYSRFPLTSNGWIGVDLFFVLSGYFIGGQLWRELDKTGTISFPNFVIRRGLRIWPLYFFIFACVSMLLPGLAAAKQHGWTDVVFLTNYIPHGIVLGGWSLCTEEQFYLLAPAALLFIGLRSRKSYRWGLCLLFLIELAVRATTYYAHTGHLFVRSPAAFEVLYYPFHTHCDGLIAGLLISNLDSDKNNKPVLRFPWLLVLAGFAFLLAAKAFQPETLDFTGLALFFGALVWWGTQRSLHLFDSRIFYWFSRLSFGMYLIHPYFVPAFVHRVAPPLRAHLGAVPSTALCVALLAIFAAGISAVTFCLVEHPFLILRTAILRRRATPRLVAT